MVIVNIRSHSVLLFFEEGFFQITQKKMVDTEKWQNIFFSKGWKLIPDKLFCEKNVLPGAEGAGKVDRPFTQACIDLA